MQKGGFLKSRFIALACLTVAVLCFSATPVAAQAPAVEGGAAATLDNLWVVLAGVLVFFMQAGFALVESGMTRAKNVINIMAKNLVDVSVGVLAFLAVGYALAFGGGGAFWGGGEGFFLVGKDLFVPGGSGVGNLSVASYFFFQAAFASTAATIVSGAMTERTRFGAYIVVSIVMTAFVYPTVVHWIWGGGFIADLEILGARFTDYAGATVVHSTGAWAALMGALFLGPRLGWNPNRGIPGHSMPQMMLGVFILWLGWFGFNGGSVLAVNTSVATVAVNTVISGAAGSLAAGGLHWIRTGKPGLTTAANGALAGLVAITAGCASMNLLGAALTGLVAGFLLASSQVFVARRGIDDPVGAISVHGTCGVWGTLAVGLFARFDDGFLGTENAGLFYGGGGEQLVVQLLAVLVVFAWTVVTMGVLFFLLKRLGRLRVTRQVEIEGLDASEHGSIAYPVEQPSAARPSSLPYE